MRGRGARKIPGFYSGATHDSRSPGYGLHLPGGVGDYVNQDETLARLENKLEALGIGYSRMELCVIELCRQIQSLVEHNAQLMEMLQPEAEEEVPQYLGSKRR